MSKLYLFLSLVSLFLWSCSSNSSTTVDYLKQDSCLRKFQYCDSIYSWDDTYQNLSGNLLFIRWLIRKNERKKALHFANQVESYYLNLPLSNRLREDFIFYDFLLKIDSLDINSVDSIISTCQTTNPLLQINLLHLKSSYLRDKSSINYSFVSSLYAEYLTSKLSEYQKNALYYLPWATHTVNCIREYGYEDQTLYFLKKFDNSKRKSPSEDWMYLLYKTPHQNLTSKEVDNLRKEVNSSRFYDPSIKSTIQRHLAYSVSDSDYAIDELKQSLETNQDNELDRLYLLDEYLVKNDLDKAKIHFEVLNESINNLTNIYPTLFYYQKQRYFFKKYKQHGEISDLINAYITFKEIINSYNKTETNLLNEHYADAVYKANNILIKSIYQFKKDNTYLNDKEILEHLIEIKDLYQKISNSRNILKNIDIKDKSLSIISKYKFQIEKKEIETKRYKDTLMLNLAIYEELYFDYLRLHEELNKQEINIDQIAKNESPNLNYQIKQHDQIIDIVKTDSTYYFFIFNKNNLKISSLELDLVNSGILSILNYVAKKSRNINNDAKIIMSFFRNTIQQDISHLFIIPDGKFFDLPFEIVQNEADHIIDSIDISYLTNISEYFENHPNAASPFAAIFSYSSEETINDKSKKTVIEQKLGLIESIEIAQLYKNKKLITGKEMIAKNIFQSYNAPILHFSSHASSSNTNLLDNYIMIRDDKSSKSIPFYGFHMKTKKIEDALVILSACNSGTGVQKPGTGVFSLSRDFLQAGAQTVIKSLWAVNEASTAELMIDFHKNLHKGHTASMALTLAKRTLKQNPKYSHPYYWAGFVLEGNPNVYLDLAEECND